MLNSSPCGYGRMLVICVCVSIYIHPSALSIQTVIKLATKELSKIAVSCHSNSLSELLYKYFFTLFNVKLLYWNLQSVRSMLQYLLFICFCHITQGSYF